MNFLPSEDEVGSIMTIASSTFLKTCEPSAVKPNSFSLIALRCRATWKGVIWVIFLNRFGAEDHTMNVDGRQNFS